MLRQLLIGTVFVLGLHTSVNAALVARWPLDEGAGDTFREVVAGNNGFLPVNLPANVPFAPEDIAIEWITDDGPPGIQNTSVMFTGEASFIETPFPGIGGIDPRTITLWVKAPPQDVQTNGSVMVGWGPDSATRKWHFRINDAAQEQLRTEYATGQNFATTGMADEEWHFVASVFPDGAEFGAEILHYLDGELDERSGGTDRAIDTLIGEPGDSWPQVIEGVDVWPVHIGFGPCCPDQRDRSFLGQLADVRIYDEALDEAALLAIMAGAGLATVLQAGDADQDLDFDQLDLVKVQVAAKYLTGEEATWGEGDWNGAPGGTQGNPPVGNGSFDQLDIIAALGHGLYLTGPYGALAGPGVEGDEQTSLVYDTGTGELRVDSPASKELTSINITSAAGKFVGEKPAALDGAFDNFAADNVFKATFGGSFGNISFGSVLPTGLSAADVTADLTAVGSLAGGGDLGNVDLVHIPESSSVALLAIGVLALLGLNRRH